MSLYYLTPDQLGKGVDKLRRGVV